MEKLRPLKQVVNGTIALTLSGFASGVFLDVFERVHSFEPGYPPSVMPGYWLAGSGRARRGATQKSRFSSI